MIDWSDAPQFGRTEALKWTLERLHAKRTPGDRPLIVEVGTSYAYSLDGLGNATLAYTWYAQKYGARFISIDCWQGSIDEARRILDVYGTGQGTAEFLLADGQTVGEIITEPIALIYEDGPDKKNQDTLDVNDEQNTWHLQVVERAMPLLPVGAMVLFDDTTPVPPFDLKGVTVVPWMLTHAWEIVPWPFVQNMMVLLERTR